MRITNRSSPVALRAAVLPFVKILDEGQKPNDKDTILSAYREKLRILTEEDDVNGK